MRKKNWRPAVGRFGEVGRPAPNGADPRGVREQRQTFDRLSYRRSDRATLKAEKVRSLTAPGSPQPVLNDPHQIVWVRPDQGVICSVDHDEMRARDAVVEHAWQTAR